MFLGATAVVAHTQETFLEEVSGVDPHFREVHGNHIISSHNVEHLTIDQSVIVAIAQGMLPLPVIHFVDLLTVVTVGGQLLVGGPHLTMVREAKFAW